MVHYQSASPLTFLLDRMLLTDDLLLDYQRCQRRAFLNLYGNSQEKDPERDFLLKLRQDSQSHVKKVLQDSYPDYYSLTTPTSDILAAARETEALMGQGVSCIYHGVLLQSAYPISLTGSPHLLIKQVGESKFGDWIYYPVNIQLGRRPKPEYKMLATFYAYLLASMQGVFPSYAEIVLRRHNRYRVELNLWLTKLEEIIKKFGEMVISQQEPEVFISRQRCSLCHWHSHCYGIAQVSQHLSLVPGVTPSRYQFLQSLGVSTMASLALTCPTRMGEGMGVEVANQLQLQARAIIENRAFRKSSGNTTYLSPLPKAEIEFYFDIEAEPEQNLDYLLGILRVDYRVNTQQFYPFLAENPEDEGRIWQEFLTLVIQDYQAPIFHFSEYEVETIKRLGYLYKTPSSLINQLVSRCFDLHYYVVNSVTFPVESYSLKSLANWIGFQWRDHGVSGDQCVWWYDQWLKTRDRTLLAAILRYNEDDCCATFRLKDWLVNFLI